MLLYHFTSLEFLESIKAEGLKRREVAVSPDDRRLNVAVWLTTNREPMGHGLDRGGQPLTYEEKLRKEIDPNEPAFWTDKREVRITLRIPSNDPRLQHWPKWAKRNHVPNEWYKRLASAGGGKHKTWWLYLGVVSPKRFGAVDILRSS
jgi:hypothetical protein